MKIICKESGSQVQAFSVTIDDECYRRDFFSIGDGTVVECDKEYFSGKLLQVVYTTVDGVSRSVDFDDDEIGLFLETCMRHCPRFDVTQEMITHCKTFGPFLLEGESRIVNI